ncbi:exonuclease domain-containing protein, partial [Desulforudis sp. 1190]
MLHSFVVCDLETTGLDPATDEIIEVGLVRVAGGAIAGTFRALVRPSFSVPPRVAAL